MYIIILAILLISNCTLKNPNSSTPVQRPSNLLYVINGYGYSNRVYSLDNIDLLVKSHNIVQANHLLTKHENYQDMGDLMEKSLKYESDHTKNKIDDYLESYNEMLSEKSEDESTENKNIDAQYFNLKEYPKKRPPMNIITLQSLAQNGIMPMTQESAVAFHDYYNRNIKFTKNHSNQSFNATADYKASRENVENSSNIEKKVTLPIDKTESQLKNQLLSNNKNKLLKNSNNHLETLY